MEISIISWFVFSLFAAIIANSKGRSGTGFFLLSIFLSPLIGIIAALIASKNTSKVEEKRIKSGTEKKCPYCAELVKNEAIICKHCGKDLSAEALAEHIKDLSPLEQLKHRGITNSNQTDPLGTIPLIKYAAEGDKEVVALLLQAKAYKYEIDNFGRTASQAAIQAGHPELAKFIDNFQA